MCSNREQTVGKIRKEDVGLFKREGIVKSKNDKRSKG